MISRVRALCSVLMICISIVLTHSRCYIRLTVHPGNSSHKPLRSVAASHRYHTAHTNSPISLPIHPSAHSGPSPEFPGDPHQRERLVIPPVHSIQIHVPEINELLHKFCVSASYGLASGFANQPAVLGAGGVGGYRALKFSDSSRGLGTVGGADMGGRRG